MPRPRFQFSILLGMTASAATLLAVATHFTDWIPSWFSYIGIGGLLAFLVAAVFGRSEQGDWRNVMLSVGLGVFVVWIAFVGLVPLAEMMSLRGLVHPSSEQVMGARIVALVVAVPVACSVGAAAFVACAAYLGNDN